MRIRDPGWEKFGSGIEKSRSGIRDKHRGSATLISYLQFRDLHWQPYWDLGVRNPDLLPVHPRHASPAGGGDQVLGKLESYGQWIRIQHAKTVLSEEKNDELSYLKCFLEIYSLSPSLGVLQM